ncbi:MAG TPA: RraA family protein [Baekduia sp.]|nr:RraA family protein [Baekduia sp.]
MIDRLDLERYERLSQHRTCDLADVMQRSHTMLGVRGIYSPIPRAAGPATTVSIPNGGFEMIRLALSHAQPGDVLVIATQGNTRFAHWGGDLSREALEAGVRGVIIDGAARDAEEVRGLGFPVYATATATAATVVDAPWGQINSPVSCGQTVVSPGDIVVADENGVVAVPPEFVQAVTEAADALAAFELPPIAGVAERLHGLGLVVDGVAP